MIGEYIIVFLVIYWNGYSLVHMELDSFLVYVYLEPDSLLEFNQYKAIFSIPGTGLPVNLVYLKLDSLSSLIYL